MVHAGSVIHTGSAMKGRPGHQPRLEGGRIQRKHKDFVKSSQR